MDQSAPIITINSPGILQDLNNQTTSNVTLSPTDEESGAFLGEEPTTETTPLTGSPDQGLAAQAEFERLLRSIRDMSQKPRTPRKTYRIDVTMNSKPGESFGKPLMDTLNQAVYGGLESDNPSRYYRISGIETNYYLRYMSSPDPPEPEQFVDHIGCLVQYLEQEGGDWSVSGFLDTMRGSPGWLLHSSNESDSAWQLLYLALGFPQWLPTDQPYFDRSIRTLYPRCKSGRQPFTTTIEDILAADLSPVPTTFMQEHLNIEGDTVKIYKPSNGDIYTLHHYEQNRAAKVFQIQSLGKEIAQSLSCLYGRTPKLLDKARELHLVPKEEMSYQLLCILFEICRTDKDLGKPVEGLVLGSRVAKLKKVIAHRRSWWPSLLRDIDRSRHQQPWLFWGSFLAIGFGICAVIQTVASVVSCYYAILAYNATLPRS